MDYSGWSRLYGGAFTMHFGAMQPDSRGTMWGEWGVTAWGCDARLSLGGVVLDDRVIDRDDLLAHFDALTGRTVVGIQLNPTTLTLRVDFAGDPHLELIPDPEFEGEAWIISLPSHQSLSGDATRRWQLEDVRDRR